MDDALRLYTLGPVRLEGPGGPLLARRRKELTLLTYLARRPTLTSDRTVLATLFWGERDERRARQSLRQALLVLRQGLGDAIEVDGELIGLRRGALEVDATAFEADLAAGRLEDALHRWGGEFLLGQENAGTEEFREWVDGERRGLRRQFAAASERSIHRLRDRGDWAGALVAAERWCRVSPGDEGAMRARVDLLRVHGGGPGGSEFTTVGAAGLLTPDMAGRHEVFSSLTAAWTRACQGHGIVVLLEGASGAGKSRLLSELRRFVADKSPRAVVAVARGYESERDRPHSTARALLAALADAPGIRAVPPHLLGALSAVSPELAERLTPSPPPSSTAQFPDAFHRATQEVAAEGPCLLICDDAGLADPASQDALATIVRRPPPGAMLVLAARGESLEGTALFRDFRQGAEALQLRLGPLGLADVERLVGSMVPVSPELLQPLSTQLHAAAGGNPGLVVSLVGLLADEGTLRPDSRGVWELTASVTADTIPLPMDLRSAVEVRRTRLPDGARRLLDAAAVLGSPFHAEDAEAIADLTPAGLASGLGILLSRGWVREAGGGAFEFTGEGTRRIVYDLIAPAERRRRHRVAHRRLLETSVPPRAAAAQLALHRSRGGSRLRAAWPLGVAAFALLAVATLPGWWQRPAAASGTAPGVISLAVEPFSDPSSVGEPGLGQSVGDLVTQALGGAGLIQIIGGDRSLAAAIVEGEVNVHADQIVLTASLTSTSNRWVVGRVRAVGPRARIDSLTELLAARLLGTAALLDSDRPGAGRAPGSESLIALKAYFRGEQFYRLGLMVPALEQLDAAIRADSQFARAWYRRAQAADWLQQPDAALASLRRARALDDRVSEQERRMYPGYEAYLLGKFDESERLLRHALGFTAADPDARGALAETLLHGNWTRGRAMAEADPEFREVLRLRPSDPAARRHTGDLAYRQGDQVRGDSIYDALFAQVRGRPPRTLTHLTALRAYSTRDTARQARVLDTLSTGDERLVALAAWVVSLYHPVPADVSRIVALLTDPVRPVPARAFGHRTLAYLALAQADSGGAHAHLQAANELAPREAILLEGYLRLTGRLGPSSERSRRVVEELARWSPDASAATGRILPETVHPVIAPAAREYLLALAALEGGNRGAATAAAVRLERRPPRLRGLESGLAASLRARTALAAGDTAMAIQEFSRSWSGIHFEHGRATPFTSRPADRVLLADLYARTGRHREAKGWYETISELSPWDLAWLPDVQRGLAALDATPR